MYHNTLSLKNLKFSISQSKDGMINIIDRKNRPNFQIYCNCYKYLEEMFIIIISVWICPDFSSLIPWKIAAAVPAPAPSRLASQAPRIKVILCFCSKMSLYFNV